MADLSLSDRELLLSTLSSIVIQLLKAQQNVEQPAQYSDLYFSQKPTAVTSGTSYDLMLSVPPRPFNHPPGLTYPASSSPTDGNSSGGGTPPPTICRRLPLDRHFSVDAENTSVFSGSRRSSVSSRPSVSRQLSMADDNRWSTAETGGIAPVGRYKTELCRPFEENGTCRYGDKCQFAHGHAELRTVSRHPKYKTDLCKTFHTTGLCPYGPRCHFVHNEDERRGSATGSDGWDVVDAIESSPMRSSSRGGLLQRMTSVPHHCGSSQYDTVLPTTLMPFDRQMSFEPRCQSLPESVTSASQLLSMSSAGYCAGSSAAAHRYLPAASGVAAAVARRSRYSLGSQAESPSPPSSSFSDSPPPLSPIADDVVLTSMPSFATAARHSSDFCR